MKIATIARSPIHSPNMASNDAAILELVATELRARDVETITICGEERIPHDIDAICHMSRTATTLDWLRRAESEGIIIINSPTAVENCSRLTMMQTLEKAGVPQPPFSILEMDASPASLSYPAWIKRAEGWSCHKDDICYAVNPQEAGKALSTMLMHGIEKAIHCVHLHGDILKFYGIGRRFFHCCYPDPDKSKFGHEHINGAPHRYPFSIERMKELVFTAAGACNLEIYGGDCIIGKDGSISIIDLNDFPSFSAVREKAAIEIAEYIIDKIKERKR